MVCGRTLLLEYLYNANNPSKTSIKITTNAGEPEFDIDTQIGRDSIDLRISQTGYKVISNVEYINTMDDNIENYFQTVTIPKEGYLIAPGETIVVSTIERIKLTGDIIGEITGRTRYARMGLSVCSATKFQSYSDSVVVLQITNNNNKVPLKIFPFQKLAQLIIQQTMGIPNSARGSYSGESELKKPEIDERELSELPLEIKNAIKKQKPKVLPFTTLDGQADVKKRISYNNTVMKIIAKVANALSAALGLLIGILCSFAVISSTAIIVMAISSVLLTAMAIILEIVKDNNTIDWEITNI